jgi:hypothetical protein
MLNFSEEGRPSLTASWLRGSNKAIMLIRVSASVTPLNFPLT